MEDADATAEQFDRQGKYLAAVGILRSTLEHMIEHQASNSNFLLEYHARCDTLVRFCNDRAVLYLHECEKKLKYGAKLLEVAEQVSRDPKLSTNAQAQLCILTYNNSGCYYLTLGRPKCALKYFLCTYEIEQQQQLLTSHARTLINICNTMAQLGRHGAVSKYARKGLYQLHHNLLHLINKDKKASTNSWDPQDLIHDFVSHYSPQEKRWQDLGLSIVICASHLARSLDALNRLATAIHWYQDTLIIAKRSDGLDGGILKELQLRLADAQRRHKRYNPCAMFQEDTSVPESPPNKTLLTISIEKKKKPPSRPSTMKQTLKVVRRNPSPSKSSVKHPLSTKHRVERPREVCVANWLEVQAQSRICASPRNKLRPVRQIEDTLVLDDSLLKEISQYE